MKIKTLLTVSVLFLALLAALAMPAVAQTSIGVQLAVGSGWKSSVVLKNNTAVFQDIELNFSSPEYSFLDVSINGTQPNVFYLDRLSAGEEKTYSLSVANTGLTTGWIELKGNATGTLVREFGGVKYSSQFVAPVRQIEFPAAWTATEVTGLAFANPNAWPTVSIQLKLTAVDEAGVTVATQNLLSPQVSINGLKPRHQLARFINQFFAGNPEWEAYVASHGGFKGKVVVEEFSYDQNFPGFAGIAITFKYGQ
jgi:hypothetical protein